MRRPKTLLAMLALVALMATAGEQTMTYTPAPKAAKVVVQTQNRAKMLQSRESVSRKKAPSADQFQGLTFYANLTNTDSWAGVGIGSVPYGIYSYTIGSGDDFKAHATDLRYNFMASAMGRDQLLGARPMQIMGVLNGVEYNGLSRADFSELWSMIYESADYSFIPSVMAYDVTTDIFYTIQYNADLTGLNLAKWSPISRMFETICAWPNRFQPMTLGFTPDGIMYCVGADGDFYELDKDNVVLGVDSFDRPARQPILHDASKARSFEPDRLTFTEEQVKAEASRCLGCGVSVVDPNRCIGCGLCTTRCMFDAIHLQRDVPAASTMVRCEDKVGPMLKHVARQTIKINRKAK